LTRIQRRNGLPEWYTVESWIGNMIQNSESIEAALESGRRSNAEERHDSGHRIWVYLANQWQVAYKSPLSPIDMEGTPSER